MTDYNLYVVHVEREASAVVVAANEAEAKRIAETQAAEILDDCFGDPAAWVSYCIDCKPPDGGPPEGWGDCCPYFERLPKDLRFLTVDGWLERLFPSGERSPDEPIPDVPGQVVMPFAEGDST